MTTYREMPSNVQRFVLLWVASSAVALTGTLWLPLPNAVVGHTRIKTHFEFLIYALTAILAVAGPLVWIAAWQRKNWARWILLASFILGVTRFTTNGATYHYPAWASIELFSCIIGALAYYFLFSGDAVHWFKRTEQTD